MLVGGEVLPQQPSSPIIIRLQVTSKIHLSSQNSEKALYLGAVFQRPWTGNSTFQVVPNHSQPGVFHSCHIGQDHRLILKPKHACKVIQPWTPSHIPARTIS